MAQVTANGLNIEVVEHGPKDGPAVMLVMGLGCQLLHWQPGFVDGLAGRGYRVVRLDNRDAGLSAKMDEAGVPDIIGMIGAAAEGKPMAPPYTIDDMAADAVGVLDALGIAKAHVVGASMGGMIAQTMAGRHGDRVLSLTSVMSTSGDPDLPQAGPDVMGAMLSPPPDPNDREACVNANMAFWRIIQSPAYPPGDAELRARAEAAVDRSHCPQGTARQMAAILSHGSRAEMLKTVRVPTFVLHGTDDRLVPIAGGERTAALIPNATFKAVDGMGHDMTVALERVFLAEIGGFIDRVQNSL